MFLIAINYSSIHSDQSSTRIAFSAISHRRGFHTGVEKIGHGGDRHIRTGINGFDEGFELYGLEPVDHHVQHGFRRARVKTAGVQNGQAGAELLRDFLRDLVGAGGDDHGRLGAVEAVHNEIHGFGAGRIGYDGVERQNPAVHGDAADDVQCLSLIHI